MKSIPIPPCPRPNGWSLKDLEDSAKLMGMSTSAHICDWKYLSQRIVGENCASVLHVNGNHFVLIYMNSAQVIEIFDPSQKSPVCVSKFRSHYDWGGVALFVVARNRESSPVLIAEKRNGGM